jgi:hypothetical protein
MSAGQPLRFVSQTPISGTGVTLGTTYYVIASGLTANNFKVSTTAGGSTIDLTSNLTAGQFELVSLAPFALSDHPNNSTSYGYETLEIDTEGTQERDLCTVIGGSGYINTFDRYGNVGVPGGGGRFGLVKDTKITTDATASLAAIAYLTANDFTTAGTVRTRRVGLTPGARADVVVIDGQQDALGGVPMDNLLDALVFATDLPALAPIR